MFNIHPYKLRNQQIWLTTDRTMYWEETKSLIVSDLHFGKTGHFRKSGIAVPAAVYKEDLQRLVVQIQYFQPSQIIIVGDMFHSNKNIELELFLKWRSDFSAIQFRLIKGNHDILKEDWYENAGIQLSPLSLGLKPFHFVHDISGPLGNHEEDKHKISESYLFTGHIHPGIRILGKGKQSLCFPCFYFGKQYAVLPAFSYFTGVAMIKPEAGESVFAIVHQEMIQIQ